MDGSPTREVFISNVHSKVRRDYFFDHLMQSESLCEACVVLFVWREMGGFKKK